jgi:hypothetical protein
MEGYGKQTYGAAWAAEYDDIFPGALPGMIDRLAEFAQGGRVLELANWNGKGGHPACSARY